MQNSDDHTVRFAGGRATHLGDFVLPPRSLLIVAIAVPVGVVSALAALVLLRLIGLITNLVFYQRFDTHLVAPGGAHHPWWLILFAPIAGALVIGVMARYGSEKIRGHGIPEAMQAILTGGSRVAPRVAVLKPLSAAISIGTGGPFGAEGPIIMTGGAVGSILAQTLKLSAAERKTLLVAGAAGGMSAIFNAPLASVLLAVELLLFEWRPRSLIPVVTSVTVSTLCRGFLLGTSPIFALPNPPTPGPTGVALALVPGLTGGLLAIVVTALVYKSEDFFERLPVHWMWWPALGGLIIGIGGLIEPRALGVGYDVIDQLLTGNATTSLIVGILVVKTLIWSMSLGSGTSGGVLAPVFMIGAALGAAEALVLPDISPGFWAMCGLAAVVGGVMRAPLTGIVFILELTHAWNDLLPMVVASVSAYAVSVLLLKRSVLTEKIARRRIHLTCEYTTDPLETFFAHEVMTADPAVLHDRQPVQAVLAHIRHTILYPVVDDAHRLVGVTTRGALAACAAGTVADATTPALATSFADDTLRDVANNLAIHEVGSAPVVDRRDPDRLVGVIGIAQLLHARRSDLHEEHHRERLLPGWTRPSDLGRNAAVPGPSSTAGSPDRKASA